MIVCAGQPYFAPYPGFFQKAALADILVILDTVQFPTGTTWITRNRFKNDQGTLWLTIPVWKKNLGLQRIDAVRICREGRWPGKHLRGLECAYKHAPFFYDHFPFFRELYEKMPERILDLDMAIINYLFQILDIGTKIVFLSELDVQGGGTELLINICRALGASHFLAQSSARKHLDIGAFSRSDKNLSFFRPQTPVYPQLWNAFIPNLSTLDLIFSCGPKSAEMALNELYINQ